MRWIGILNSTKKIEEGVKNFTESNPNETINVSVIFFEGLNSNQSDEIKIYSNYIIENKSPYDTLIMNTNSTLINNISELNFIKWIDGYHLTELELDRSSHVISADFVWGGLNTAGVTVGISDGGIQHNHPHFSSITVHDAYDYVDNDNNPEAVGLDHGNLVAGIVSGSSTYSGRLIRGISYKAALVIQRRMNPQGRGVGPHPQLSNIWDNLLDPDNNQNQYEPNSADIISISWRVGNESSGEYTPTARKVDEVVRGYLGKEVLVIKSAGNTGSWVTSPGAAKNAVVVGASADYSTSDNTCDGHSADPDNLYVMSYSSRGTQSGIVKPDILAPGSKITSTSLSSTYKSAHGTSLAAPHVAGVAAQILQLYNITGTGSPPKTHSIYPDTIKAFLLSQTVGGGTTDNININEGWGRIDAHRAVRKTPDEIEDWFISGDTVGEPGSGYPQNVYVNTTVPDDSDKFIVTMVYSDLPGDVLTSGPLKNDLDLYLVYPNGTTVKSTLEDDNINNVEKYVIDNPISGKWRIHVKVYDLYGSGGKQRFALKWQVIKKTTSIPLLTVDLDVSQAMIKPGDTVDVYGTVSVNGILGFDVRADMNVSSGVSNASAGLDGSDWDKDTLGNIPTGESRNTKTFVLRGDTVGTKTIIMGVKGGRDIGGTYYNSDTETFKVCNDDDNDGYFAEHCGGDDCDDNDENIHPGVNEGSYCADGKDNNCNDYTDCADGQCTQGKPSPSGFCCGPGCSTTGGSCADASVSGFTCTASPCDTYGEACQNGELESSLLCSGTSLSCSGGSCEKDFDAPASCDEIEPGNCEDSLGPNDERECEVSGTDCYLESEFVCTAPLKCDEKAKDACSDNSGLQCEWHGTYEDNVTEECEDGCGAISQCDEQLVGYEYTSCTTGGATYFADRCSSACQGEDADNICRSSAFEAGCTAASECNGVEAGTGGCSIYCQIYNPSWWNPIWLYRKQVNITNNNDSAAMTAGTTINITFDHHTLVSEGKSLLDGGDIRILFEDAVEMDFINFTPWNRQNTTLMIKLQSDIPASGLSSNYYLYYTNDTEGSPPAPSNKKSIFEEFDAFDDESINTTIWSFGPHTTETTLAGTDGVLRIDPGSEAGWGRYLVTDNTYTMPRIIVARHRSDTPDPGFSGGFGYAESNFTNEWRTTSPNIIYGMAFQGTDSMMEVLKGQTSITGTPYTYGTFKWARIDIDAGYDASFYYRNDTNDIWHFIVLDNTLPDISDGVVRFDNTKYAYYVDEVWIIKSMIPHPTITLGTEETQTPKIDFVPPTPANDATLPENTIPVNVSVSSLHNFSAFIDFNRSLIGWWSFEDVSAEGIAYDHSTHNNDGTMVNFITNTTVSGKRGEALDFSGSDAYVDAGSDISVNITGEITIEAWIFLTFNNTDQKIAARQDDVAGGYKMGIYADETHLPKLEMEVRNSTNSACLNRDVSGGTELLEGVWYHVVGVYRESDGFLATYVNGNLDRQMTSECVLSSTTGSLLIGKEPFDNSLYFNGTMDEVRIWDRVLNETEIKASYEAGIHGLYNNFTDLFDETYTFRAHVIDENGNTNQTEERSVTVSMPPTVTNLTVIYTNSTERIFYFVINNFGNSILNNLTWTLDTGETNKTSNYNDTLQPGENVFVYVYYDYSTPGSYPVTAYAYSSSPFNDFETITIAV